MVLEATMICVDNSEWMRNGDYPPTRLEAQREAVNLLSGAKTQSNPENTVGILTMAEKSIKVCLTPISDLGKILTCMHDLKIGGEINLAVSLEVAQLALKHRQNKNQLQRIIVFAGSPVKDEQKALETIGKKLKKNSVAIDVVFFGEEEDGKVEKLEALVAAANTNDNSHIVHVPPGPDTICDVLINTPIFTGEGVGGSGSAAADAVVPDLDPELAIALRVSMEEERARQEVAAKKAAEDGCKQENTREQQSRTQDVTMTEITSEDVDDALLQQELSMSHPSTSQHLQDIDILTAGDDEKDLNELLADQSFVSAILCSLPGVNPNDSSVKDLLASIRSQSESLEKKNEDGRR